jgi:hypothetical protein
MNQRLRRPTRRKIRAIATSCGGTRGPRWRCRIGASTPVPVGLPLLVEVQYSGCRHPSGPNHRREPLLSHSRPRCASREQLRSNRLKLVLEPVKEERRAQRVQMIIEGDAATEAKSRYAARKRKAAGHRGATGPSRRRHDRRCDRAALLDREDRRGPETADAGQLTDHEEVKKRILA